MIAIRLQVPLKFDHCELPAGMIIQVPAEKAREFIQRGIAERAEPERAVIEPQETRARARARNAR